MNIRNTFSHLAVTTFALIFLTNCGGSNDGSENSSSANDQTGSGTGSSLADDSTSNPDVVDDANVNSTSDSLECFPNERPVTDLVDAPSRSDPQQFHTVGGNLFFIATDRGGPGVFRYSPETDTTTKVAGANPSSSPYQLTDLTIIGSTSNEVFFADSEVDHRNIWRTDSSSLTPTQVISDTGLRSVISEESSNYLYGITAGTVNNASQNNSIIRYPKSGGATEVVAQLSEDSYRIHDFVVIADVVYFYASILNYPSAPNEYGLYRASSDGAVKLTSIQGTKGNGAVVTNGSRIAYAEGREAYEVDDGTRKLVVFDTTTQNTAVIEVISDSGIVPDFSPIPRHIINNVAVFTASRRTNGTSVNEVWTVDLGASTSIQAQPVPGGRTGLFNAATWAVYDDSFYGIDRVLRPAQVLRVRSSDYSVQEQVTNFTDETSLGVYSVQNDDIGKIDDKIYFPYLDNSSGNEVWEATLCN